jgi:hypothetical protein
MFRDTVQNRFEYSLFLPLIAAVAVIGLGTAQANASILLPGDSSLSDSDLVSLSQAAGTSSVSAPTPTKNSRRTTPIDQSSETVKFDLAIIDSSPLGTNSTSSSNSGVHLAAGNVACDNCTRLFGWDLGSASYAVERSQLLMPSPPITTLFRPPRVRWL